MAVKKGGLGKGLEALFADNATETVSTKTLRLSEIEPNREQPRKEFAEEALSQLADSIRQHGVLQPLMVRPLSTGGYQLVAGERRWRASRMAGLTEVPVVIKELTDSEAMQIALIENLQREDLNPIEEAEGYKILMEEYSLTQDNVAEKVGRSRPSVANAVRLLNLPSKVIDFVKKGDLSTGHARALLALTKKEQIEKAAEEVIKKGMTVRDTEKYVKLLLAPQEVIIKKASRESYFDEMEIALKQELGRKITIKSKKDKGTIEIEFYNKEDLADIAEKLAGER